MNSFLAILAQGADSASICAAVGKGAQAALTRAIRGDGLLTLPAPTGVGLHVWEGRIEGDDLDGEWRRAAVDDLERFGMPLSEPASVEDGSAVSMPWTDPASNPLEDFQAAAQALFEEPVRTPEPPKATGPYCCKMREKFVIGVVATNESVPTPTEMADHVLHWGKKIIFATSFCPFCGTKIDHSQTLRVDPDAV